MNTKICLLYFFTTTLILFTISLQCNHLKNHITVSVTRKIVRCSICMFQQSTRACLSCSSRRGKMTVFCDTCFEQHGCRNEKSKCSIWLVENCQECQNLASRWHCRICNQNLCTVCFDVLHSGGNRIHHSSSLLGYHSKSTNIIHNVWSQSNVKINNDKENFTNKLGLHGYQVTVHDYEIN